MSSRPRRPSVRAAAVAALSTLSALTMVGANLASAAPSSRTAVVRTGEGLPDVDRRFDGVAVKPSAAQLAALRALGDVEVGWTELATPHSLRARRGTLTGPSAAAPDAVARGFLRSQALLFRQQPADIAKLRLTMLDRDPSGATFLRYEQLHGARQVHGSSLLVVLDQQRRVVLTGGTLAPSLGIPVPPLVSADDAIARVAGSVNPLRPVAAPRRHASRLDGTMATTFHNTLALPTMRHARPVEAELVTVPTATGGRTAWQVRAEVASNADYETLVDATTGDVVYRRNQWSSSEPHGLVHTGDDPEAGGQVAGVLFSGADGTWVAGQTTAGNNTNTFQDLNDDETADAADQPSNADQHFDYPWTDPWGTSGTLPTTGDERDAVVTQLFYYTNWFHDYAYGIGFTETARNFQNDNFGRGGSGGDAVSAEADDSYGTGVEMWCQDSNGNAILCRNNANFNANGADGTVPRMQMYVGDDGRRTQRAMNRDTVIHEYTHGISGRIISDGNLAGGLQSGALGEGWSDALATSINDDPVYGEYNNGNYTGGIRGVDYSSSTRAYGDICTISSVGCQVHADGTIWATAMWEVRAALIAKHGFAAGKSLHERLIVLGMKSTLDTPSFHDARTGYLVADALLDLFGDPNAGNNCLLWRVFADNELGVTDAPDSDDDSSPNVSTDTPDECAPTAVVGGAATVEGTDVQLDGTASTVGGDAGDSLSYAWDLDGDGQHDDSTSPTPLFTNVGNDGSFPISLQVTNTAGYVDTAGATVTVANAVPAFASLGADGPKPEGSVVTLSGLLSDAGWEDDLSVTVDWNDGSGVQPVSGSEENVRPDGTLSFDATHTYGDNGTYQVEVCRSDDDTTNCAPVSVDVTNVAPTVTIDAGQLTNLVEGESLPVLAHFSDPGWLDTYPASTVDAGTPYLPVQSGTVTVTDEGPPANVGTVNATVSYGDNGTFDVTVSLTDDDGGTGQASVPVTVANVDPTATIDETGTVLVNGVPTFFADTSQVLDFLGRVQDPGSDDETTTWSWDDGTSSTPLKSRVNPGFDDPMPSPDVLPRDFTTADLHAWTDACMYDVGVGVTDDDAGTGSDSVKVLVTGAPTLSRGAGYWQHQYKGNGNITYTTAQLDCYLEIAGFLSNVFNEVRDASTRQKAYNDIFVAGLHGDLTEQLDRQLLTAWVNFANGGVEYTELLDTNGDLVPDTSFVDVMANAEAVRLAANPTRAQLAAQRDILQRVNGRDGI